MRSDPAGVVYWQVCTQVLLLYELFLILDDILGSRNAQVCM